MRFMIIVKATKDSEAGVMPPEKLMAEMANYHEELQKAGVLLDGSGLQASAKGWRVKYSGAKRTVVEGPFAETTSLIAGYTLIQTRTREEAMDWARRFPNPSIDGKEAEIEVRQLFELDDFAPGAAVERFKDMSIGGKRCVACKDQKEIDHFWEKLSQGGQQVQCGWLKDKYGLSWQVNPTVLGEMLSDRDPKKAKRVMQAMLQMKKIDIKRLQEAYRG